MSNMTGEPVLEQLTQQLAFVEKGMLGFESLLRFELSVYDPTTPFYWLRSLDDSDVAFIVMEPCWLVDDYSFDLSDEDMSLLDIRSEQDIFVLVVCTIPDNPLDMTANLLGPLIFHRKTLAGRQLILDRLKYPVRFPVFQEQAQLAAESAPQVANDSQKETP